MFNDTATTEIYTLSLHDALPIFTPISPGKSEPPYIKGGQTVGCSSAGAEWERPLRPAKCQVSGPPSAMIRFPPGRVSKTDRKSTRLNSSHANISYAVFCLKTKNY